jgi:hypothetical protein
MSGFGRITQETIEVLGPDEGFGRITQEIAEALGPTTSTARITQLYAEVLAPVEARARVTQLYAEPLGPPTPPDVSARITQLIAEVLGPPKTFARITQLVIEALGPVAAVACLLPYPLIFTGNVSGAFYRMTEMGAETIPVGFADSSVIVSNGIETGVSQTLAADGTWITWLPESGALEVSLSNGFPVRTLWVVTNLARSSPPQIPVYASSLIMPLWKQLCSPG